MPWNDEFDAKSFNYAPVTVAVVLIAVGLWWLISARHTFTGPVRQIQFDDAAGVVDEEPPPGPQSPPLGARLRVIVAADTLQVIEPATEAVLEEVPRAGVEQADEAVARAKEAFGAWRDLAPGDRASLLHRLASRLEEAHEELAVLEARNGGKPISARAARCRWWSTPSATTPGCRSGSSATRSRWPAVRRSRSANRWASSR